MKKIKIQYLITSVLILIIIVSLFFVTQNKIISSDNDISVVSVDKENILNIILSNQNGKTVIINENGKWHFENDVNLPVLQSRAIGIAYDVSTVFAKSKVSSNAQDLAMYGLSPAVAEVDVTLKDGTVFGLLIGNKIQSENGYYLKTKSDSSVYIVDIGKGQNFKSSYEDLTDYTIDFILSRENIKSITLSNDLEEQILIDFYSVADGVKQWMMTYPTKWPVSSYELDAKIFNQLLSMKADQFITESFDYDKFIDENKAFVGITDKNSTSKFVRLGKTENNLTTMYVDEMYYPILVNSEVSNVKTFTPIDLINKIDFAFLGTNVKVDAIINDVKITDFSKEKFKNLVINEMLEPNNYSYTNQYIKFYNYNDEIVYKFYYLNNDEYAVSTDENVYFSVNKHLINQIIAK